MTLGKKVRCLREVEGTLRGLYHAMTQHEVAHAVKRKLDQPLSGLPLAD
jgi:hypothetical protein